MYLSLFCLLASISLRITWVASVQGHNGLLGPRGHQMPELFFRDFNGGGSRCHPLLIQNVGPATCWLGQGHHRRKLPPKRDRFLTFWQIMHMLCGSVCRGHRVRACNFTGINPDPLPFFWIGFGQIERKDFSHLLLIDASIFKRFIQTRPFSLKPERLREFWKRLRRCFGHEGIDGIEQGILRFQKTVIQVVTKSSNYVNVHLSKFPWCLIIGTLLDQTSLRKVGGPFV